MREVTGVQLRELVTTGVGFDVAPWLRRTVKVANCPPPAAVGEEKIRSG
jgi:hypothetical protein